MAGDWPLVGRDQDIAHVLGVLESDGQAGVLLTGAAGVGKTRLGREALREAAEAGWHVARAVATGPTRDIPFGAVLHLLPEQLPARLDRTALLHSAAAALRARAAGGKFVVGVDDVHYLDDLSAALVAHLAVSGAAKVVLTQRSGDTAPEPIMALYRDGVIERLALGTLERSAVVAVLDAALGGQVSAETVSRLWDATEGNLLYLHELVLDAVDAGTLRRVSDVWTWTGALGAVDRLSEVLGSRLTGLRRRERELLDLLAVGGPLPTSLAEQLSATETMARLEHAGLVALDGEPEQVRLAHPLYAEVLLGRMPRSERRRLSLLLADGAETGDGAGTVPLLRLVTWRVDSGTIRDPSRVVAAAEMANQRHDPVLAERLARAALQREPSFTAALQLGAALNEQGRFDEAESVLGPLAGTEPDDEAIRTLNYHRMRTLYYGLGDLAAASAACERSEAAAADPAARRALGGWRATMLVHGGRLAEAESLAGSLLADGDENGATAALAAMANVRLLSGQVASAVTYAAESAAVAGRTTGRVPLPSVSLQALALVADGRIPDTRALLADAWPVHGGGQRRGGDVGLMSTVIGALELQAGRPATALRLLREAAVELRLHDAGGFTSWCLSLQVEAQALLGDGEAAAAAATEALATAGRGFSAFDGDGLRARAWLRAAAGDPEQAAADLVAVAEKLTETGHITFATRAWFDALRLDPRPDTARRLLAVAAENDSALSASFASYARGILGDRTGDLLAAADGFEACGSDLWAAEAAAQASRTAEQEGRHEGASAAALRAAHLAERCESACTPALVLSAEASAREMPPDAQGSETVPPEPRGQTQLRVLGRLAVAVDRRVIGLTQGAVGTVVALLALRRSIQAEELIELLWPDVEPPVGRERLRGVLSRVRRSVASDLVVRHGTQVALSDAVTVDAETFLVAATTALREPPEAPGNLARCEEAVAVYGGELLPGDRYSEWTVAPRERFSRLLLDLLDRLADGAEKAGDAQEAVRWLERGIDADPYDESRYLRAAQLLADDGRRGRALATLERARSVAVALGVPVTDQITRFQRELRSTG